MQLNIFNTKNCLKVQQTLVSVYTNSKKTKNKTMYLKVIEKLNILSNDIA